MRPLVGVFQGHQCFPVLLVDMGHIRGIILCFFADTKPCASLFRYRLVFREQVADEKHCRDDRVFFLH